MLFAPSNSYYVLTFLNCNVHHFYNLAYMYLNIWATRVAYPIAPSFINIKYVIDFFESCEFIAFESSWLSNPSSFLASTFLMS